MSSRRIRRAILCACLAAGSLQVDRATYAQDTDMKRAYAALEAAASFKKRGDLVNAERMYRIVLQSAPRDSSIWEEADGQVTYFIPLMRVQRLLWDGNVAGAEKELLRLQLEFEDQPIRRQEINRILLGVRTSSIDAADPRETVVDEQEVISWVKHALERYHEQNDQYPTSRDALKELLDFSRPPLGGFEIWEYRGDTAGYLLILHSQRDDGRTLTLHNTGLLQ